MYCRWNPRSNSGSAGTYNHIKHRQQRWCAPQGYLAYSSANLPHFLECIWQPPNTQYEQVSRLRSRVSLSCVFFCSSLKTPTGRFYGAFDVQRNALFRFPFVHCIPLPSGVSPQCSVLPSVYMPAHCLSNEQKATRKMRVVLMHRPHAPFIFLVRQCDVLRQRPHHS